MTTVPAPDTENARSTQSLNRCAGSGRGTPRRTPSSAARNSSRPVPFWADTATTGALRRPVPANSPLTCCVTAPTRSGARSALVRTISPRSIPNAANASRWSLDWACQPSSTATTKQTTGAGPSPASILPRNRSCPGTSTKATLLPDGRSVQANPRSMVSPRRFSSAQRSGSIPVRARTSVDLP